MVKKIITARINKDVDFQINFIKNHLGVESTTQVLTQAVNNLYDVIKEKEVKKNPFEILEELNLIGCFEGEKTLSENYKEELSDSLKSKFRSKKNGK